MVALSKPRPVAGPLRTRERDGSYPFLSHRTVAEVWAAAGTHLAGQAQ